MSLESVAQVESDLGVTDQDIEILRSVRLVWQKLQKLRGQALKDEKYATQYRDLLAKSLIPARAQQTPDEAHVEEQAQQFWQWYDRECYTAEVKAAESSRGRPHQAWCEKWLPGPYQAFTQAIAKTVERPTPLAYDQAKSAATAMIQAYMGMFKG